MWYLQCSVRLEGDTYILLLFHFTRHYHCFHVLEFNPIWHRGRIILSLQARLWLSKLGVDTSIGWASSSPLVEIGLGWLPKLGVDTSPRPRAHRRAYPFILGQHHDCIVSIKFINLTLMAVLGFSLPGFSSKCFQIGLFWHSAQLLEAFKNCTLVTQMMVIYFFFFKPMPNKVKNVPHKPLWHRFARLTLTGLLLFSRGSKFI